MAKLVKASPPPLPQAALLTDADLIDDEDITQVVRSTQPTSVDVEIDCFNHTEPPPESRPRRKLRLLAGVTSLLLVATTFALLWGLPVASNAFHRLDAAEMGAARAPAVLSLAAVSNPALAAAPQKSPVANAVVPAPTAVSNITPSAAPRPKLSAHSKRGNTILVKQHKKPIKLAKQ